MNNPPLLVSAIRGEPIPRIPVWFMRQAGRYLPEYRKVREKHSFLEMARIPEIAAEITLQPLRRFALDGAIVFSDILVVPEALGFPYEIVEASGPVFERPYAGESDLRNMTARIQDIPQNLGYFYQALRILTEAVPEEARRRGQPSPALLGFAGAPFTLAAYMVEGKSKTGHERILKMAREHPEALDTLIATLERAVTLHLTEQIKSGAQMVQLFESFAGLLPRPLFQRFCVAPAERIARQIRETNNTPLCYFARGGGGFLRDVSQVAADVYSIDWQTDLRTARQILGPSACLQGNLDPAVLLTQPEAVIRETEAVLADMQPGTRHIFNLGHGVLPGTPLENVEAMLRTVHDLSPSIASTRTLHAFAN